MSLCVICVERTAMASARGWCWECLDGWLDSVDADSGDTRDAQNWAARRARRYERKRGKR